MAVAAPAPAKIRWGELEEDDADDLGYLLPPPQVIGPDESGTKRIIEYKFNKDGDKVKVTTITRIRKIARARLNKRAIERRSWAKFGAAAHEDSSLNISVVSTEEICIERPRAPGSKTDEPKAGDPLLAAKGGAGAVLMVCRLCGKKGDHWTSKCPNKDLLAGTEGLMDSRPPSDTAAPVAAGKSTYVPPSLRGGADRSGADMIRRRNDENSVRVTNLSEDTHEPDLLELFRPFGHVTRVYVAVDQKTGISRGFGFVNFVNKEDAERAINKLNGYGYDNLILRVEWATPRAN